MGDVDVNGDGLIDMRIDGTARGIAALRTQATTVEGALTTAFGEIDRLTGLLGKGGTMSDQFMKDYRAWRDGADGNPGLDQSVRDVPVNYRKIADVGDSAVASYREAEQNATNQFLA